MTRSQKPQGLFLLLGMVLFLVGIYLASARGSYYWRGNADPEYVYLFNSVNLLTGDTPRHVDHPGTTMQEFGALVILAKWFASSVGGDWEPVPVAVFSDPESYLRAINVAMNLLIGLLSFLAARQAYRCTGSWLSGLALQLSWFLFPGTWIAQARASTEPLLLVAGLALMIPLLPVVFPDPNTPASRGRNLALLAGLIFGFGVVTKITFAVLGSAVLLFPTWRRKAWFLGASAASFLVFTLPIWSLLPRVFSWFWALLTHTGRYGSGEVGLADREQFRVGLEAILRNEPVLFTLLIIYAVAFAVLWYGSSSRRDEVARRVRVLLICGMISTALMISLVAKHYAPHYLLPALVFVALPNAAIVATLRTIAAPRWARVSLVATALLVIGLGMPNALRRVRSWTEFKELTRAEVHEMEETKSRFENCQVIGHSVPPLPTAALHFGSNHAGRNQKDVLTELYPDTLRYENLDDRFNNWRGPVPYQEVRDLVRSQCVLLMGRTLNLAQLTGFEIEEVASAGGETFHRLRAPELPRLVEKLELPTDSVVFEAESFRAGNVVADTGIIRSQQPPSFAEYEVSVPRPGRYGLWIRFASGHHRPLKLLVGGELLTRSACVSTTGGRQREHRKWEKVGEWEASGEPQILRLERAGEFPYIDKLALVPAAE